MKTRLFARLLLIAGMTAGAQAAMGQENDDLLLGLSVGGDTSVGAVNVSFRDFSTAGIPSTDPFSWITNTIELQITTDGKTYNDAPPNDCCPVVGKGSLTSPQQLQTLFLNFNPALDLSKLRLYWTGDPMPPGPAGANVFPTAGDKPSDIAIGEDTFFAGGGQLFDVFLRWTQPMAFSKLLLVYDDGNTNIESDDFFVASSTVPDFTGPSFGPLVAAGGITGTAGTGSATIAAIPEPGTFATLAVGLLALGIFVRRRVS